MLERILVPLDTSETSKSVVPFTTFLATHLHQPVHLVTVIPDTVGSTGSGHDTTTPRKRRLLSRISTPFARNSPITVSPRPAK